MQRPALKRAWPRPSISGTSTMSASDDASPRRTASTIRRPRGRAILGGLLVAIAAVLTFTSAAAAGSDRGRAVVVAARPIAIGHRITDADLTTSTITASDTTDGLWSSTGPLIGSVALGPIGAGEFLQHGSIAVDDGADGSPEITIAADRDHALNGELRPGETIDVLATYGTGNDAVTITIARGARVIRIEDLRSSAMTNSGRLLATLAVGSNDQVLDAVHAANVATITFVRTTSAVAPSTRNSTTGPLSRSQAAR